MTNYVNGFFPGELIPNETIGGCIDIFENVWPDSYDIIDEVENQTKLSYSGVSWHKAETIGQGPYQDARTNLALGVTASAKLYNNPVAQRIHNQFNMILLASTIPYAQRYNIQEQLWHEEYNLLRYSDHQQYHRHYDSSSIIGRAISAICYLNNDYSGGEIEFPNFKVKIKPESGMLILFPSSYPYAHIAHPVTDGVKYCLVTWIRDRQIIN
jgi:hypothetical protein